MYVALIVARLVGPARSARSERRVRPERRHRPGPRSATVDGPWRDWSSRATASASRSTRRALPRASLARSASLQPRSASAASEPRVAADVLEPDRHDVGAVVVAAEADVVDAGHLAHVLDVRDDVVDRRAAAWGALGVHVGGERRERRAVAGLDADLGRPPRPPRRARPRPPGETNSGTKVTMQTPPLAAQRGRARRRARCAGGRTRARAEEWREDHRRLGDVERVAHRVGRRRARGRRACRAGSSRAPPRAPNAREPAERPARRSPSRPTATLSLWVRVR